MEATALTAKKIACGLYEVGEWTIEASEKGGFNIRSGAVHIEWFQTKRACMAYIATGSPAAANAASKPAAKREFVCLTSCDGDPEFHVHGAGCADIKRGVAKRKYWEAGYAEKHENAEALVAEWVAEFDEQDQGWAASDFKVFPCCKS